jgi:hypothetical protein
VSGYVLLLGGLIVAAFAIRTALIAYRSPIRHPKWWAFVCLVCAPVTTLNADAGSFSTNLLSLNLFGIGYSKGLPDGPTLISIAFPVGALLFLARRRKLVASAHPMLPEDQLPE